MHVLYFARAEDPVGWCARCVGEDLGSRGVQGVFMVRSPGQGGVGSPNLLGFAGAVACGLGVALVKQHARPFLLPVGAGLVRGPRLCRAVRVASGASPARGGADHQTCCRAEGAAVVFCRPSR